jgi:dephospho-CoA kinase
MIKIGLTGGIASGKSEAAHALARLGAHVVIADDLAVDLVAPGSPVLNALVEEFGDGVLLPDGRLNRARLAEVAFASGEALERLAFWTSSTSCLLLTRRSRPGSTGLPEWGS